MLLQIDAWYGGGKSTLLGLLDGHPNIAPNPLHDATQMFVLHKDAEAVCKSRDIEALRRLLAKTQYYIFEKAALLGAGSVSFGSGIELHPEFKFDFYQFDKSWVKELMEIKTWTPQIVLETIYRNYAFHLTGKKEWDYHASMSWSILELQKGFADKMSNSKSIFVERPIAEIIAVRSGRKKRENSEDTFFAPGFEKLLKEGEVFKIKEYLSYIDQSIEKHPDRFMKVSMNALIFDRENAMKDVAKFLNVPFDESMLKWTFLGEEVKYEGFGYLDKINDKPEYILSEKQLSALQKQIKKEKAKPSVIPVVLRKVGSFFHKISARLEK